MIKSDEYTWFFRHSVESVDLDMTLFEERRVRRYAKHHFTNVWTIDTEEKLKKYAPMVDTVTYQFINPEVVKKELKKE